MKDAPESVKTAGHRWTSTGILQCVRTLIVSLPSTIADMPWRPCEAMTIRSSGDLTLWDQHGSQVIRGNLAKPAGEGTGLGLSITHDIIVKQHSGSIEVDTKPGEFTEVRIILPRTATLITDSGGQA
jgi:Histidine kinase-, DNA gyrase B-, and HSP90-like ATPase